MQKKDLMKFIEALSDDITEGNKALYKEIVTSSVVDKFDSCEDFYFSVIHPFDNFIDGYVRSEVADNSDVVFLMRNFQFVENAIQNLIKRKEGRACCADKSRTIVARLLKFYSTGEKIEFDYTGEYTYHLPKKIFTTHDEIVEFFTALQRLYYGDGGEYILALANLLQPPQNGE